MWIKEYKRAKNGVSQRVKGTKTSVRVRRGPVEDHMTRPDVTAVVFANEEGAIDVVYRGPLWHSLHEAGL